MGRLFLILVIFILPISAVGQMNAPIKVNLAFRPPLSDFCSAIVEEAFKRIRRTAIVRVDLPAERAIQQVDQGVADADCLRVEGVKALYHNLIQVPTALFDVEFVSFSRPDLELSPGWAALAPYRVGAVKGWKLIELNVLAVKPKSFIQVGSADSLFRMLALGRIDVAALNRLDGLRKLGELKLLDTDLTITPLATASLYFTLHKRHAVLASELDEAFQAMQADGAWQEIYQRIFVTDGQ